LRVEANYIPGLRRASNDSSIITTASTVLAHSLQSCLGTTLIIVPMREPRQFTVQAAAYPWVSGVGWTKVSLPGDESPHNPPDRTVRPLQCEELYEETIVRVAAGGER
jgi:hypothetical protein